MCHPYAFLVGLDKSQGPPGRREMSNSKKKWNVGLESRAFGETVQCLERTMQIIASEVKDFFRGHTKTNTLSEVKNIEVC